MTAWFVHFSSLRPHPAYGRGDKRGRALLFLFCFLLSFFRFPVSAWAACSSPAGNDGDMIYNSASHYPQYCASTNWQGMWHLLGGAGGGCSSPAGNEGDMMYNSDNHVLQYCSGSWQALGQPWTGSAGAGCASPTGSENDIIYSRDFLVPQYCDSNVWRPMGRPYSPTTLSFNAAGSLYVAGTSITGAAATGSSKFTFSVWVMFHADDTNDAGTSPGSTTLWDADPINSHAVIGVADDGTLHNGKVDADLYFANSSGTKLCEIITNPLSLGTWYNILFSVDVAAGTVNSYVNDVSSVSYNAGLVNGTINFTNQEELPNASASYGESADIADFWIAPGTYIDFSQVANRRKFISASHTPVYLGANGELPTGSSPPVFFSGPLVSTWLTSKGASPGTWTPTGTPVPGSHVYAP
jgi:hypothetical protein